MEVVSDIDMLRAKTATARFREHDRRTIIWEEDGSIVRDHFHLLKQSLEPFQVIDYLINSYQLSLSLWFGDYSLLGTDEDEESTRKPAQPPVRDLPSSWQA